MSWVTIDANQVRGTMSAETLQTYQGWLVVHPDKAGRLGEIIAGVVEEFRSGLRRTRGTSWTRTWPSCRWRVYGTAMP